MTRWAIAGLIAVGLALGIWVLWPREDSANPTSTTAVAAGSTTTTEVMSTTTTTTHRTTSTSGQADSHVVETVEEAEEELRELWFGWFEGIYNQDEDRIREVVATDHQLDLAISQFGEMPFERAPAPEDFAVSKTEILRSDRECLAIEATIDLSGFATDSTTDVHVVRWSSGSWRFFSLWSYREDLWESDCEALLDS